MTNEGKFLEALKNVFVGARVAGESGYINLMRVKAHYAEAKPLFIRVDPYSQYVFLRDTKMLDNAQTGQQVLELDTEKMED
ncbi:MAG: hypothetical protein ACUVWR_04380 [Anaerolineae bacterium]